MELYHRVREAVAGGKIRIAWEDTNTNLSDLLTYYNTNHVNQTYLN
jgi:hypothetical protein